MVKRTGVIHNFTMDVNPGYRYIEKFHSGIQWSMMECKRFYIKYQFQTQK